MHQHLLLPKKPVSFSPSSLSQHWACNQYRSPSFETPDYFQPFLQSNRSEGPDEQEAERMARKVINSTYLSSASSSRSPQYSADHRSIFPPPTKMTDARLPAHSGSAQPLDDATRTFMESRFVADFSQVRIHNDEHAAQSARALDAYAYTFGNHIVFGTGDYSPATTRGRYLLAHELTHVLQQRQSPSPIVSHTGMAAIQRMKKTTLPDPTTTPTVSSPPTMDEILASFPGPISVPRDEVKVKIQEALKKATEILKQFLKSEDRANPSARPKEVIPWHESIFGSRRVPPEGAISSIKRTFGSQNTEARARYQKILEVLQLWNGAITRQVQRQIGVSGWDTRFGRGASTGEQGEKSFMLVPETIVDEPLDELAIEFIHEAAHGSVGKLVLDTAQVGSSGFRTMSDTKRLDNAYHYEAAVRMSLSGNPEEYFRENLDPSKSESQAEYARALKEAQQTLLTVRVQAENTLRDIVYYARNKNESPSSDANNGARAMGLPIATSEPVTVKEKALAEPIIAEGKVTVADITKANAFVQAITALQKHGQKLEYSADEPVDKPEPPSQGLETKSSEPVAKPEPTSQKQEIKPGEPVAKPEPPCQVIGNKLLFSPAAKSLSSSVLHNSILVALLTANPSLQNSGVNIEAIHEMSIVYQDIRKEK